MEFRRRNFERGNLNGEGERDGDFLEILVCGYVL